MSHSELPGILKQQLLKLRFSDSIVAGSVIFPLSGVAFLLVPLSSAAKLDQESNQLHITTELQDRLDRFVQVHKNCHALCMAPLHGDHQRQIYKLIQRRYLATRLSMMPVHNTKEAVKTMLTVAKALCKPTSAVVLERLNAVIEDQLHTDYLTAALKLLGLNSHESHLLEDGLGSLASIAVASRQELLDCGLESGSVNKVLAFFTD